MTPKINFISLWNNRGEMSDSVFIEMLRCKNEGEEVQGSKDEGLQKWYFLNLLKTDEREKTRMSIKNLKDAIIDRHMGYCNCFQFWMLLAFDISNLKWWWSDIAGTAIFPTLFLLDNMSCWKFLPLLLEDGFQQSEM